MRKILSYKPPTNAESKANKNFYWSMQNLIQKIPILYEGNPKKYPKATDSNNIICRARGNNQGRDALTDSKALLYKRNDAWYDDSRGDTRQNKPKQEPSDQGKSLLLAMIRLDHDIL